MSFAIQTRTRTWGFFEFCFLAVRRCKFDEKVRIPSWLFFQANHGVGIVTLSVFSSTHFLTKMLSVHPPTNFLMSSFSAFQFRWGPGLFFESWVLTHLIRMVEHNTMRMKLFFFIRGKPCQHFLSATPAKSSHILLQRVIVFFCPYKSDPVRDTASENLDHAVFSRLLLLLEI